jgi:hypothetical protein
MHDIANGNTETIMPTKPATRVLYMDFPCIVVELPGISYIGFDRAPASTPRRASRSPFLGVFSRKTILLSDEPFQRSVSADGDLAAGTEGASGHADIVGGIEQDDVDWFCFVHSAGPGPP